MNISIKNVREHDWRILKSEAAKHDLKIAEFLNKLLAEHKKKEKGKGNWNEILYGKRTLTERDAEKIKEAMKEFRKEFEFR